MSSAQALSVFGLMGKCAIVTGAASGIGRATAALFAEVGANVLLADIDEAGVHAAAEENGSAYAVCDIADEAQVQALFARAQSLFRGRLDVLANVAAYRRKADTMTMPASEWDIMHAVTTRGTFLMMREAIKIMRAQDEGAPSSTSLPSAPRIPRSSTTRIMTPPRPVSTR